MQIRSEWPKRCTFDTINIQRREILKDSLKPVFAEVLLPLAIPKTYTYAIPIEFIDLVHFGIRVEVPLRNRRYSGLVCSLHQNKPISRTKNIISIIDDHPIIHEQQMKFWKWMAHYYCAHLGEVMNVALPSGLKLSSESKFILNDGVVLDDLSLTDDEFMVSEAMSIQNEMTIDTIQDILNKKTVYPIIKSLMQKRVLYIKEELKHRYKAKVEDFVMLLPPYDTTLDDALELVSRSEKQARALISIMSLAKSQKHISKKSVYQKGEVNSAVLKALEKKKIISIYSLEISRINLENEDEEFVLTPLSSAQTAALEAVRKHQNDGLVTLLHGITGSGKTRIYVDLIIEAIAGGGQVLMLLPEIALTTQIVNRLEAQIGSQLLVYHSKINDQERVEIWHAAMTTNKLFIGARSALFLPFYDLKLIIIDEEHDSSYKQGTPNPRYQGRDSAVVLAKIFNASVLLGTATPSLETMHNCQMGKYGYVELPTRYGDSVLPSIEIIDLKESYKKGLVKDNFSKKLLEAIEETVLSGDQVILFQNRRGYAPIQRCNFCAWTAECPNCDVTLTFHQAINDLKCHYCGYRQRKQEECPSCGNHELHMLGAGTEKIEEVLSNFLPNLRIARFDYDSTRTKGRQEQILNDFRFQKIDVLVGTQMITKGFDFDHISLVGVISADGLLSYPDFRAVERSFQLFVQVSGRAGRRDKPGKVLIQAFNTDHPVLKDVIEHRFDRFYHRETKERKDFIFPPHFNLIAIWVRHLEFKKTKSAAIRIAELLTSKLGKRVQGPIDPPVVRVRNQYQQIVYIRIEKEKTIISKVKDLIIKTINIIKQDKEIRQVKVSIDVDPY